MVLITRTPSPAGMRISSKSPVVSGVGTIALNFGMSYGTPPGTDCGMSVVWPMTADPGGGLGHWSSRRPLVDHAVPQHVYSLIWQARVPPGQPSAEPISTVDEPITT
jgi:hypothetical protein